MFYINTAVRMHGYVYRNVNMQVKCGFVCLYMFSCIYVCGTFYTENLPYYKMKHKHRARAITN